MKWIKKKKGNHRNKLSGQLGWAASKKKERVSAEHSTKGSLQSKKKKHKNRPGTQRLRTVSTAAPEARAFAASASDLAVRLPAGRFESTIGFQSWVVAELPCILDII
jgi:hypothetical protein